MECKFFGIGYVALLLGYLSSALGSAVVTVRVQYDRAGTPVNPGACSVEEDASYATAFVDWVDATRSQISVSSCSNSVPTTTTTTTTTTLTTTTSTSTTRSTSTTASTTSTYTTSTTTKTKTPTNTTRTTTMTPSSTSTESTSTSSTSTSITTSTRTTSSASTTPTPTSDTTTTISPITTTTPSTTPTITTTTTSSLPTVCPPIPPPSNPLVGYSDADRNAYCDSADGAGSYCKCDQVPSGQLCKKVPGGSALSCSCSAMCGAPWFRRLSSIPSSEVEPVQADVVFADSNVPDMNTLVSKLQTNQAAFIQALGYPADTVVTVLSFVYTQGGSTPPAPSTKGGVVYALIDLSTPAMLALINSRRLLEEAAPVTKAAVSLTQAIVESVDELIVPRLPQGTTVACDLTSSASASSDLTANVSISVPSDITASQSVVTTFLQSDTTNQQALPSLISAKANITVAYSEGYIPVIWSSDSPSVAEIVLNIMPYVLAGIGVLAIIFVFGLYKYRFVIRSRWDQFSDWMWSPGNRSMTTSHWTQGRFGMRMAERGKSEISSTPDTATNVDDCEFDELDLRERTRHAESSQAQQRQKSLSNSGEVP